MYKPTGKSTQIDLFTSSVGMFRGKSLSFYEDTTVWHNRFCKQITLQIDEDLFKPLYNSEHGSPNSAIRILVVMMVLKEAEEMSDEKIFDDFRFISLIVSVLVLLSVNESIPTESTYY